jgi:fatty-acyl-CoA synthase
MKVLRSMEDHLARSAMAHRDRVALVDTRNVGAGSWGEITYARLVELVRAQAAGLDQLGVDRGECVAVVTRSSARVLTSLLAVSGTGRSLLPVDVRMSVGDMASAIEHSGARMLLVDPEFDRVLFHDLTERSVVFGAEHGDRELYRFGADAEPWALVDDAIAILEYPTSAVTRGEPAARTHRGLRRDLAAFGWQLNLSERDVYLHTLPLCQSRSWGLAYALTAMGALQVGFDNIDAVEILRRVDAYGVTVIDDAPAVGITVLGAAASWDGLLPGRDRVRVVHTGPPPPTTDRVQAELGWEFVSVSGLTPPAVVAGSSRPRPATTARCRRGPRDQAVEPESSSDMFRW